MKEVYLDPGAKAETSIKGMWDDWGGVWWTAKRRRWLSPVSLLEREGPAGAGGTLLRAEHPCTGVTWLPAPTHWGAWGLLREVSLTAFASSLLKGEQVSSLASSAGCHPEALFNPPRNKCPSDPWNLRRKTLLLSEPAQPGHKLFFGLVGF